MKVVALVKPTTDPNAAQLLASATGVALAEARMRLAPEPPALLARLAPNEADALVVTLRKGGLSVLAWDESTSRSILTARTFKLGEDAFSCAPRSGPGITIPWDAITVLLKAASAERMGTETSETKKQFSLGAAVLTGGLVMRTNVSSTQRTGKTEVEQVILVHDREGRLVALPERELDFSCLGEKMQPVRIANMATLARLLKEKAPHAFYDERLVRLGTRPLPFVMSAQPQLGGSGTVTTRSNTALGIELLAGILCQAVDERLLP
jgi:hypothetical protein